MNKSQKELLIKLIKEEIKNTSSNKLNDNLKNIIIESITAEILESVDVNENIGNIISNISRKVSQYFSRPNITMLPPMRRSDKPVDPNQLKRQRKYSPIPDITNFPKTPETKAHLSPFRLITARSEIMKNVFPTLYRNYKGDEDLMNKWFARLYSGDEEAKQVLKTDLKNYISNPSYLEPINLQKLLSFLDNLEDPERGIGLDKMYGDKIADTIKKMASKEKERLQEIKILKEFIKNIISRKLKLI